MNILLRLLLCLILGDIVLIGGVTGGLASLSSEAGPVQEAVLDASQPLFVPTNARVTTTLRFPGQIGAPEGRGFTEDEAKSSGEYLVSWTRGEHHLTVTPLPGAGALNLNVPYEGQTYVFYFYPVEKQFQALASLNLVLRKSPQASEVHRQKPSSAGRVGESPSATPSPGRLLGLVDKLRLLRALAPGPGLDALVQSMSLELVNAYAVGGGAEWREAGGLELLLTHVVRDPRSGTLGFALRVRNTGGTPRAPDVTNLVIRCGGRVLGGALGDLPAILMPGEEQEAFLAAPSPADFPLSAANDWKISLGVLP